MTAQQVEIAVAKHFGYRANLIVPNVHWGLGLAYEADMVVLRPSGWAIEVEIKVSASDIKRDLGKRRQHDSRLFRQLYFAVPEHLAEHPDIPERAGVLAVSFKDSRWRVKQIRTAKLRPGAVKMADVQRRKLAELAAMRIWDLKHHLMNTKKRVTA